MASRLGDRGISWSRCWVKRGNAVPKILIIRVGFFGLGNSGVARCLRSIPRHSGISYGMIGINWLWWEVWINISRLLPRFGARYTTLQHSSLGGDSASQLDWQGLWQGWKVSRNDSRSYWASLRFQCLCLSLFGVPVLALVRYNRGVVCHLCSFARLSSKYGRHT